MTPSPEIAEIRKRHDYMRRQLADEIDMTPAERDRATLLDALDAATAREAQAKAEGAMLLGALQRALAKTKIPDGDALQQARKELENIGAPLATEFLQRLADAEARALPKDADLE